MPGLAQSTSPSLAPVQSQRPEQRPERASGAGRGNAAAQQDAGVASFPEGVGGGSGRDPTWGEYARRLWDRVGALVMIEDPELRKQGARAALAEAVRVQDELEMGQKVDLSLLPAEPQPDELAYPVFSFPPEWIAPARLLLEDANPRIQAANPVEAMLGGMDRMGKEAADYGVASYQTQSNNLAAPEATCNGTSLAMVLERLGYAREDLVNAIEAHLKRLQIAQQLRREKVPESEIPRRVRETDLSCVYLAPGQWEARVRAYLRDENSRESNYQRPRGASASGAEMDTWAKAFKDNAGIDDLALLLLDLLGIERTEVNVGGNPGRVLEAVHDARGGPRPTTERIDSGKGWEKTKPIVRQALEEGGAAMMSIRHKGAGSDGTHIVAVQACEEDGCVVDDPYGRVRPDYTARKSGDAYALPGKTRATSGLKNAVDSDREDWRTSAEVSPDETRGMNSRWSDSMITDSWQYVVVFRRGDAGREGEKS